MSRAGKVLLLSAIASGQGKTSVAAALAAKLRAEGQHVCVFKIGADFIDPHILRVGSGSEVDNLDLWLLGRDACLQRLQAAARQHDYVLIEGAMGLYDGVPSSADLAREFEIPVIVVLDVAAMAQTAAAILQGLRDYGPVTMAGFIANQIASAGHAEWVARGCRDIPLLGYLPRLADSLPERHLGLYLAQEIADIEQRVSQLAQALTLNPAFQAIPDWSLADTGAVAESVPALLQGVTIAVARDAAFCFLYPANLQILQQLGASLVFFSPLADQAIPAQAQALYLPGGYPELYGEALAKAERYQLSLRHAWQSAMPIWAECGGMMSLCCAIEDWQGRSWPMSGILPIRVRMHKRLHGLGLQVWHTGLGELRGHSFHYSSVESELSAMATTQCYPNQAAKGEPVYQSGQCRASYFHAYFPSNSKAAAALFLARAWPVAGST